MNIFQIATLNQPIREDLGYGPIEMVIYNIDRGLHELGHHSIVSCSGDSNVMGERYTTIDKSFTEYHSKNTRLQRQEMKKHLAMSLQRAQQSDIEIIHIHDAAMVKYIFNGVFASSVPIVMTLHIPVEGKGKFRQWSDSLSPSSDIYFVPISTYQKTQCHGLFNMQKVIHHGIDVDDYPFLDKFNNDDYLFSIGRITQVKGVDKAIKVAQKIGSRLVIAGNIQNKKKDRAFFKNIRKSIDLVANEGGAYTGDNYYEDIMKPILDSDKQIIYIGELDNAKKKLWYSHALATLFPIQWGEPFGLVLIESMACGTPVVALRNGSVAEIVVDAKTGFVVDSIDEMAKAVKVIYEIEPNECRKHVNNHFSITGMAQNYAKLYSLILEGSV